MKRRNETRRSGVVLLLILGLMAMFAISVLSYMVVTSNMAESAKHAEQRDRDTVADVPPEDDVNVAIRNLVVGSNNGSNPVGPFSILENMYGNWTEVNSGEENTTTGFYARIAIFPNLGYAVLTPCTDFYGNNILSTESGLSDYQLRKIFSYYFEESGNVVTLLNFDSIDAYFDEATSAWNSSAFRTSTYVLEKVVTDPSSATYRGSSSASYWLDHYFDNITEDTGSTGYYTDFDFWHFKIELSDDLKEFVKNFNSVAPGINAFNRNHPVVAVRLNRPAFSGTGAGGFSPGLHHDSSFATTEGGAVDHQMNLPYYFWMNPSAPDMWPYWLSDSSAPSFRSYWAHLIDVNFNASGNNYTDFSGGSFVPRATVYGNLADNRDSVRMNPSYTAADGKTPFLARYFPITDNGITNSSVAFGEASFATFPYEWITPSFHRPELFQILSDSGFLTGYRNGYGDAGVQGVRQNVYLTALIRKLTPRPIPLDHWNFTGGNPDLDHFYYHHRDESFMTPEELVGTLGHSSQWDVDNDHDGVREGIWVPSGLPIRYDKNGTPFATMFSYTVLDLDGHVNVNTAGNWDQLPNTMAGGILGNAHPYNYVDELDAIWNTPALDDPVSVSSPFGVADDLDSSFFWNDDLGERTQLAERGSGFTVSGVLLYEAIAAAFSLDHANNDKVRTIASNLLWRRNLEPNENPDGLVDASGLLSGVNGLSLNGVDAPQPGYGDSDVRNELLKFFDPTRLTWTEAELNTPDGVTRSNSLTATLGEAKMIFPWRGKTTLSMTTRANLAPAFDWADAAFRSYDPLGEQVYSYPPRYSKNPQLAYQNVSSLHDSPYILQMLECILRPTDSNVDSFPQLARDLRLNLSDVKGIFNDGVISSPSDVRLNVLDAARAKVAFTTLSSDVPALSVVFPENDVDPDSGIRYGNYGFVDLVRRNVRNELERIFEEKGLYDYLATGNNQTVFEKKVEEITTYLASMLPKEILSGEKIDLNALAQKDYWLDVEYDDSGNLVQGDRELHNAGLVKKMEYARGLYLVVMTLLYEDMNAHRLYDADDERAEQAVNDDGTPKVDDDGNPVLVEETKLHDYIEGSFDLLTFKDDDKKKDLIGRELMATRIAQWCVNVVDFSDPDATMTPFFFDPTPFDGWWVKDYSWIDGHDANGKSYGDYWKTPTASAQWTENDDPYTDFLFPSTEGVPSEQMYKFFLHAFKCSEGYTTEQSVYYNPVSIADDGSFKDATSEELLRNWLQNKYWYNDTAVDDGGNPVSTVVKVDKIEKLEDQTSDLGFRLVWGMERPDLVLTETLNFHDLGIADTKIECDVAGGGALQGEDDETFDQVRRPEGSSYLELYCTANPNVPQSRELYDYVDGSWKLRLSKTTPVYKDYTEDGLTLRELDFPIWRVAISDSSDPRGLNAIEDGMEEDKKKDIRKSYDAVYNKARNSVLDWLIPHRDGDKYYDDINFFSMQPRQFRNAPLPTNSTEIANIASLNLDQGTTNGDVNEEPKAPEAANFLSHWKDFNLFASNALGSAVAATYDDARLREVELDRILWFTHIPGDTTMSGDKLGTAGKFPDALRTFGNKANENVYLKPNQYLVVGPEKKRSIGSAAAKNEEEQQQFGKDPSPEATYASSFIDLEKLQLENLSEINDDQKYQYMEAVANIGGRGFNISEPLWTASEVDPYYAKKEWKIKDASIDSMFFPGNLDGASTDDQYCGVRNIPFEIPEGWANREDGFNAINSALPDFYVNRVANYPIVKDKIFGLGTIPAYKSAFVQRVADPNRPYHPVMNPYITVDWNMMDLTVFTGEAVLPAGETVASIINDRIKNEHERSFSTNGSYPFNDKNKIKLHRNLAVGIDDIDGKTISYDDAFSSRQWGAENQKSFAPKYSDNRRPNPWSRAVEVEGDKGGLEKPVDGKTDGTNGQYLAMSYLPKHTLGFFNDHGVWGHWADVENLTDTSVSREFVSGTLPSDKREVVGTAGPNQYKNLNAEYMNATGDLCVYRGAPRKPFEHLVWNDAPFSNPYELMLVPASAPGRFGLEFVRRDSEGVNFADLYDVASGNKNSLGALDGVFGFDDWYTVDNIKQKKKETPGAGGAPATVTYETDDGLEDQKDHKAGSMGPYLNFFASSGEAGDALNLVNVLEMVRTPSYYLGVRKIAGFDANNSYISDLLWDEYDDRTSGTSAPISVNTMIYPSHREPGKININTLSKPVWHALVNTTDRVSDLNKQPGTPWGGGGLYWYDERDTDEVHSIDDGFFVPRQGGAYFRPSYTTPLWIDFEQSPPPVGAFSTLLGQSGEKDVNADCSTPIFDNIRNPYRHGDDGNVLYAYRWKETDADGREIVKDGETTDVDMLLRERIIKDEDGNIVSGYITHFEPIIDREVLRYNLYDATAEMQRLSGLTTTRSNVFAAWVTVGYFEVERCNPGVNMPAVDPDGNPLTIADLTNPGYKWYYYYQAIYPDGYTYGKELGEEFGETKRHRGFSIIDRSIPVDFRRGNSVNYEDVILMKRVIE